MQNYQQAFIEFAIAQKVLCFGEFTLKSGRVSPYFFNFGRFNTGASLAKLGQFYAHAIQDANPDCDMLFGPAYKGIPIVSATAIALAERFNRDLPYAFNRKEAKAYGEGGHLVGAPLQGNVLVLDDVITMGNTMADTQELIKPSGASISGMVIALDRRERGHGDISAVEEVTQTYQIPVISVITLDHVIEYLQAQPIQQPNQQQPNSQEILASIAAYQRDYGVIR